MRYSYREVLFHGSVIMLSFVFSFLVMHLYVDRLLRTMVPYAAPGVFLLLRFVVASVCYALIVLIVACVKREPFHFFRPLVIYFSVLYVLLLGFMLFVRQPEAGNVKDNYELFHTVRLYLYNHVAPIYIVTNLLGNVILFIPIGSILLSIAKKVYVAFLLALVCTGAIEVAQKFYTIGSFDVDDILLNFIGSSIGIMGYMLIRKEK